MELMMKMLMRVQRCLIQKVLRKEQIVSSSQDEKLKTMKLIFNWRAIILNTGF